MKQSLKNTLSKLTQEEIDNLNNLTATKEIEFIIQNFSIKKIPGPNGFPGEFQQILKEEIMPVIHKLFQKNRKEWNASQFVL